MAKNKRVSTLILREDLERLKTKSGSKQTKKALQAAVEHYLKCPKHAE